MTTPGALRVGETIGALRVVELLGEGGMGKVYRAVDERLGREVALKEMRAERRRDARARVRFRREARILSRLEHPNICRVYELIEVGESDILVMELVRGRSLRELAASEVDTSRTVEIMLQVARALAAAHGMSIVHRDLKPENIMVDDGGMVRVLDFGLAQSFDELVEPLPAGVEPGPERTEQLVETLTGTGDLLGTPRYMSPEQARCETVTAASDLYSFGLILLELLTGRPPYPGDIPARTLLRRAVWGDVDRSGRMSPALRGIVDQLLDLEPGARPGALEVAGRLRAFLDAPRRRLFRALAAAAATSLVVALIAVSIAFVRTRSALRVEAAARERSEAMHEFLADVLSSGDPRVRGPDTRVRDVLDDGAALIDRRLADHPETRAVAHQAIGRSYLGLGLYDEAIEHLETAARTLSEAGDTDSSTAIAVSSALVTALWEGGRIDEAERLAREIQDRARVSLPADETRRWLVQAELGTLLSRQAQLDEALPLLEEARQELARIVGEDDDLTLGCDENLAAAYLRDGRSEDALRLYDLVAQSYEARLGTVDLATLRAKANLANTLRRLDRDPERAERLLLEVVDGRRQVLGPGHPTTLKSLWTLGVLYKQQQREAEAETVLREVLDQRRATLGPRHPDVGSTLSSLAPILGRTGRFDEAEAMLREAIGISSETNGPDHPNTLNATANLANLLEARGDLAGSLATFRDVHRRALEQLGAAHPTTLAVVVSTARVMAASGLPGDAAELLDDAVARLGSDVPADDPRRQKLNAARAEMGGR